MIDKVEVRIPYGSSFQPGFRFVADELRVPEWGWTDVTNAQYGYVTYELEYYDCTLPPHGIQTEYAQYSHFVYHDNKGNGHPISYTFTDTCGNLGPPTGTGTYQLKDNSGYTLYRNALAFTAFTSFGAEFAVPVYLYADEYPFQGKPGAAVYTDTNGNQITASSTGTFTDTMGITVLTVAGVAPNSVVYTYKGPNNTTDTVTVNYTLYTVQTAFGVSGIGEFNQSNIPLVSSIGYSADGSSYTFGYECTPGHSGSGCPVTGRLNSITLRTGGTIAYQYTGGNQGIESDGTTAGLKRTTSDGFTTYVRSGISSSASTTTYTDATGNQTVSQFLINSSGYFYETDRATYTGTAGGTPLLDVQTCYNTAETSCTGNSVASAFASVLTTTFRNAIQADQDYRQYAGPELVQSDWNGSSDITATYDYNEYTGPDSIPFFRLASVISSFGSKAVTTTTYGYDETSPSQTSGLPQHISVSTTRGNMTSVHQWTDSAGDKLNTTVAYDDAGQKRSVTDTNSDVTTYAYDTSTDTLLTNRTLPAVNGVGLSTTYQFDTNTGLVTSATDPNGTKISYSYDGMLRPSEVDAYDSGSNHVGETQLKYSSFNQVGVWSYQNASGFGDTETLYDGYGRVSRVAVSNGQGTNPWYQQDTSYDANGDISFRSYAYQGTGWGTQQCTPTMCPGGGDTYSYDALGRVTKIAHADSTAVNYTYNGRATQVTDESGVTRISQADGLGRLTNACEISSHTDAAGNSPAACGLDIAGTGFVTLYSYALGGATHTTTVTQGSQTRTFTTDWLGRPTSVTEPESGTATYSYSYNSTGLAVTRKRPKANQTNASVLTNTTSQYDALGRVVSISYDDGTPAKTYSYDAAAGWSNFSQTNLKGRLSQMWAASSAGTAYSYDAMGRVVSLDECVPSGCGNSGYNKQVGFAYDWQGNLITESDPASGTITYTRSAAGEITSIVNQTYTLTGSGSVTLVSNVQNGPFGPYSWSLANGLTGVRAYDSLGRNWAGWVCQGSSSTFCTGGTQFYGYSINWKGPYVTGSCDTALNYCASYGYDDMGRLNSSTGGPTNYTWTYDRWGNRWNQTPSSGGLTENLMFNTATNQVNNAGFTYDAAGNVLTDGPLSEGFHSYTYDADGNEIGADSNTYFYDAQNRRVRSQVTSGTNEFVRDAAGRITSVWPSAGIGDEGHIYGDGPGTVAFRAANGATYFAHTDWMGTDRMHSNPSGSAVAWFTSLPFGDGGSVSDTDQYGAWDFSHYAGLDDNSESATYHAQFRQYSPAAGRWMSPDPYGGSYDFTNPQSLNRYSYVMNNALSATDPVGLEISLSGGGYTDCGNDPLCQPANTRLELEPQPIRILLRPG